MTTTPAPLFASVREARRYDELCSARDAGEVIELELHPIIGMRVNDQVIGPYCCSFRYRNKFGEMILEQSRHYPDPGKIKAKVVEAMLRTTIRYF